MGAPPAPPHTGGPGIGGGGEEVGLDTCGGPVLTAGTAQGKCMRW